MRKLASIKQISAIGATYFHSGKSKWHENNLHFIFDDGKHKFYNVK